MGRSEWVFLIKSKLDVNEVITLVNKHNTCENNDLIGEELQIYALLKRNKMEKYYLCVGNGGRDQKSNFIINHYPRHKIKTIYFPFDKPQWFGKSNTLTSFWSAENEQEARNHTFIKTPWDIL